MPPHKRITHNHEQNNNHHYQHHRPSKWMLTIVMLVGAMVMSVAAAAADEKASIETKTVQPVLPPAVKISSTSSSSTPRDEIYIDDEGIEGSGGRGEIHDDLEKEPDYSGSGFGPDDEDSATNHHSNTNSNNRNHHSSSIIPNSGLNSNTNRLDPTSRKDSTRVTEYDLGGTGGGGTGGGHISGSGDGADDDDNDNDDDDDDDEDDDDYEHGIIDTDDNDDDNIDHTDKIDHGSHIDPYDKHDDKTNDFIDVDNEKQKINEDDDNDDHDIYTDVTDLNESDAKIPDRSGGSDNNKDILKPNNEIDLDLEHRNSATDQNTNSATGNEVLIMNAKGEDRTTSFFAQPGILAAVIGGAVVGLLCAILVVMFIVYRMRKKDEGSYALDEPKRSPAVNSYAKNGNNREFYA